MKLVYRWPTGAYNAEKGCYSKFVTAPITTSRENLIKFMEQSDLDGRRWSDRIGLAIIDENQNVKDTMSDSFAVRRSIFLYPEYMPLRNTIMKWLDQNVKKSVQWEMRTELASSYMSRYIMILRVCLSNEYTHDSVSITLPYSNGCETHWHWYGEDSSQTREEQPFRGDWIALAQVIFNRLCKLELMGNITPPTSLRELFKSA